MDGIFGQQQSPDGTSEFNAISFLVRTALGRVRTAVPVVVKAIKGGGVGIPPTVSVQPLVAMTDGQGNTTQHGILTNIPVLRLQGGKSTIIIDPVVDDIGLLLVSDRDISALKANSGKASAPGSFRRFNLADSVYLGGFLNPATPEQYLQATSDGWKLVDKHSNTIETNASGIVLNGVTIDRNGNITAPGDITAGSGGADSVGLQTHKHPGNNLPPTPGT